MGDISLSDIAQRMSDLSDVATTKLDLVVSEIQQTNLRLKALEDEQAKLPERLRQMGHALLTTIHTMFARLPCNDGEPPPEKSNGSGEHQALSGR